VDDQTRTSTASRDPDGANAAAVARAQRELGDRVLALHARCHELEVALQASEAARERDREELQRLRAQVAADVLLSEDGPLGPPAAVPRSGAPGLARRAGPAALLTVGTLLVAYSATTALWQEPLSALRADRAQAGLDRELEAEGVPVRASSLPAAAAATMPARAELTVRAAARLRDRLEDGDAVGRLEVPSIGLDRAVVEGVGTDDLERGPGHYRDTSLPGLSGTTGIAGHRTTFGAPFRHLDRLRAGDRIRLRMSYGTFAYRVVRTQYVKPSNVSSLRVPSRRGRLVLTTCHPPFDDAQRLVVIATQERT
jgi:LPXTG-site transpeptidase (sortase) family protein